MSDINKQMAEFAKELWENYIKPKVGIEFSDTVSYYMATVVSNDGYNRVTIKRPFDDAYQVSCLDDMAGLEAGDTVLVLRFGNGTNNANHIVFGKGNGNMNYTAAAATATATEASVEAGRAAEAAADAIESAEQAASAAESAQQSALEAQESAETANQAANNALIGLATVEGVVDTVNWFAEHKTASTDTSVVPSKTYYEYNPVAGTLSAVTPEGDENPSEEGWYELSEAISNYVASHVATTNDGLYVVGLSNGWKVLVSSGTGTYTAGIFLIDPSGNIAQATTANGITFDDSKPFYIGDNNASIVFDGNGHISISGIGVSIGSTGSKSIDEVLSELGASIKTIEYGVGNSATSHSDITSWSSNTPEWQEDKYIWQRTTTNGLTYTYTCIQGAAGEPGAPGAKGDPGVDFSQGKMLYTDPSFKTGTNDAKAYNNSSNGNVIITRSAKSSDNPMSDTSYELVIANIGAASPGIGGFYFGNASRANAIFVYRIIAKIPTGRSIVFATNPVGDNHKTEWLTPVDGTGKFTEYIFKLTCGVGGSFGTTGLFYITGNPGTSSSPVYWYVAYATCFDMTNVSDIQTTEEKIDNLEIGGRNLSTGTGTAQAFTPASGQTYFTPIGFYPVGDYGVSLIRGATTEDEWVVSFDYAVTGAATATQIYVSMNRTASSYIEVSPNKISVPVGNSSGHFSTVFQLTSEQITYGNKWLFSKTNNTDTAIRVTLSNFMFEKGNRASSWSPAPEDIQDEIDNLEIGGRNYAATNFASFPIGTTETRASGVTATLLGGSTFNLNGSCTTTDWFFSSAKVFCGLELDAGTYQVWGINAQNVSLRVGDSSGSYVTGINVGTKESPTVYPISMKRVLWFTPHGKSGVTFSNQKVRIMIEKGDYATDWSPAPEDVEAEIVSTQTTANEALNKHGFCSCSTAAGTAAKTATLSNFQLKTGSTVHVTFTNANSVVSPTLNINSTGAKTIRWNNGNVAASPSPWAAGECVTFVYDGTYWVIAGQSNILADNIVAGSIAADRIKTNVISAVNGGTGTINADKVNIGIGGRNYLRNSNKYSAWYWPSAAASYLTATSDYIKFTPTNSYAWWGIEPMPNNIPIGEWDTTAQYTLSIDFKIEGKTGSPDYPIVSVMTKSSTAGGHGYRVREKGLANLASVGTSNWARYTYTFSGDYTTWTSQGSGTAVCVSVWIWLHSTSSEYTAAYFRNIKLEKGNVATDWSPAPADEGAIATDYITNISNGGITVTGNSASSKIEIASTVKVIRDSTHFSEMTASDFNVYSGNATYPVAKLGQVGASLSGDGAGVYLARILKTTFVDTPTAYGGTFELYNTSGGTGVRISAGPSYGTQLFYNSSNKTLLRIGSNESGQGEVSVFKATSSTSTIAAKIGTLTVTSGGNTLVNNEPTLAFYDNGTMRSWYSLKRAFISDGTRAGYVVYGNTANHGFNIDYLTTGRINFYVDGTSIGYATITSSDERMKTDIKQIDERYKDAVSNVELKNFHFDFNDPTRAGANLLERFGAVAQDVIAALEDEGLDWEDSEIVETLKDDDGEYYVINYVPFLVARLAADEDRIKELEDKNAELEARLAAIEAKLGL